MIRRILLLAWVGALGCAAPKTTPAVPNEDLPALKAEVTALKGELDTLRNRLGHFESELVASNPEGEFTRMAIDWVRWSDDSNLHMQFGEFEKQPALLCHVVEWNGFGRLLRFTRKADHVFFLEAQGHPTLKAHMAEGGICDAKGSTRLAILQVSEGTPQAGVEYAVRPRNEVEGYRWEIADTVRVVRGR